MRHSLSSFRNRLLLLVGLSIIPAAALTLYVTSQQRIIARENVQREAVNAVRLVSAHQERLMESGRQFLLFFTHLPAVRMEDAKGCEDAVKGLMPRYPLYANVGAARSNGDLFCSGLPLPRTLNVGERLWFKEVLKRKDFVVGEYQPGRVTGETTITFASPVLDGDEVTGVAFAALDLAWIDQIATQAVLPEGTMLLVADDAGKLLVRHPDPLLGDIDELSDMNIVLTEDEGVTEGVGPDGVVRLFAYAPLARSFEDARIMVIIGIPTAVAYAEVNRLLATHLAGLAIIGALSLLLAAFWGKVLILRAQQASERLATIVESSYDAIVSRTLDGTVLSWNKGAEKIFGFTAEEMTGQSVSTIIPPDKREETEKIMQRIKAGERVDDLETMRRTKDGRLIYVSQSHSPLRDDKGDITAVSIIARDITERKELDIAQSEFVSLASHQLRTPLTAIRWSMEMLLNDTPGKASDQKELLGETMHYAVDMCDTIETMLIVSRIEAGKIQASPVPLELKQFLSDLLELHKSQADTKQLSLKLTDMEQLSISTDPTYLREVVTNLVSNAIRYTPSGGNITLTVRKKDTTVEIAVADNGLGIPVHEQEKIFSKFFRAGNAMKSVPNGTGLGLYLAHSLTQMLGGTIGFTSAVGKGTTFTLELPA